MVNVSSVSVNEYNNDFDELKNKKHKVYNSSYIKHKVHENKIDEFFWTNIEAPHERISFHSAVGSVLGVVIPTLLLSKKQQPKIKINSFKNFFKRMDLEYGVKEIISLGLGGALGGLAGGLLDRNEKKKLDKIQEATFQILNISFPTLCVGGIVKLCEKSPNFNKPFPKILLSAVGMAAGAYLALTLANKVDNKIFDKYNVEPDRKFKAKDFVVHADDVFGALILAKVPFAEKIHINRILPLIFAWSGFHVGES